MKRFLNRPEMAVEEMIQGLEAAYPGLRRLRGQPVLVRHDAQPHRNKVALISGGGSGHEPAHAGYVGRGMLDAAVLGNVFTSPSTDAVLAAIRAVAGAAGTLLIVKNYTGDRLNFGLAAEIARGEGLAVEMLLVGDDVALAESREPAGRRGLAGTVLVHKIAGAAAESGANLATVMAEAREAAESVKTMGVALSGCTPPGSSQAGFALGPGEVELGLGIHGEPGARKHAMETADHLIDRLIASIDADMKLEAGERVALLLNNLGGTTHLELAIAARRAIARVKGLGAFIERFYMGTLLTSLEMAGLSLSILRLNDARISRLDAPTDAFAWPNPAGHHPLLTRPNADPGSAADNWPSTASNLVREPRTPIGIAFGKGLHAAMVAISASADHLNELDHAVGDGDLGSSLARGVAAIQSVWPLLDRDEVAETLHEVGLLVQRVAGGTSGPLYGAFLIRAGRILNASHAIGKAESWATAFREGCRAIADLGGAAIGDRTMLDALEPASEAFSEAISGKQSVESALRAAASAAKAGAKGTARLSPRRGRSIYLGERALGHVDPGAEAVAIWITAVAQACPHS